MANPTDWNEKFEYSDFVRAGDIVFLAGKTGLDADGNHPEDPAEQYRLAFESIAKTLAEAGCTPADVVDLVSYHVDYPNHMGAFMAAKSAFHGASRPAWTAIGVARLGQPDTLVEIKATAHRSATS